MMERRYYDSESISRSLSVLEKRFELSSADFYKAHQLDCESIAHIPHFHRNLWAGLYRTQFRLSEDAELLVAQVERTLEYA